MAPLKSAEGLGREAPIEFIDLKAQQARLKSRIDAAIARVLDHGQFIMGPEVQELERRLAAFCGARHAISCSSGTDALLMPMMAMGLKPGDAVICPAFTFTATPETVALLGATPVFADVDPQTFNLDPDRIAAAVDTARALGFNPRFVLPVDLFGQPADHDRILEIATACGLNVISDAAQSFGATYKSRSVGQIGVATATSFFPAKPLGCYGDGGAVFTDDDELADRMRSIRAHGKGTDKYDIARIGINGRLDTLQAAILIEKLQIFAEEIEARNAVAERYNRRLAGIAQVPPVLDDCRSVWAQYTLRFTDGNRDAIAARLKAAGVPTAVYYPRGVHEQPAYAHYPVSKEGVMASERAAREVLSLPMHPYLSEAAQDRVIDALKHALA